ncbi:TerB family tellurite resistance protein [Marinomonas spartinae]|uniref:tellurite resistance TerB family protein n=1 Tax=Marinomonas spartinae TaxID=1792290 RepID=UPI0018F255A6|nr:TerB family tellurite resistance protein [Marinomonas spartinae]MBJ7554072.1 TerB family tellurite resistance protein [Marinomonas spartinae]
MLQALKSLFQVSTEPHERISYQRAVAALMMEVIMADDDVNEKEVTQMKDFLKGVTDLGDDVDMLFEEAKAGIKEANDLYQFTKVINDNASLEQKMELLIGLWRVAYADGDVDAYEDHRIRSISDLLFMPHSEFIQAKLIAQKEMQK